MSDATKSLRDTIISASEDAQSAWCVRPAPDHPARAAWEVPFRKQLDHIATLCRSVTTSTVLPPFVIAYLREYNAAWNDHKRVVNIEALEPAQDGLKDLPPFIIDEGYQLRPKKGWWSQYAVEEVSHKTSGALSAQPSTAGDRKGKAKAQPGPPARPSKPAAASKPPPASPPPAPPTQPHHNTRSSTQKKTAGSAKPPPSPPPKAKPNTEKGKRKRDDAPTARKRVKKAIEEEEYEGSDPGSGDENPEVELGPLPSEWEPVDGTLLDTWVPMPVRCKACMKRQGSCRINFAQGTTCNKCAKQKATCSHSAIHPRGGRWSNEQRRWILYTWAQNASEEDSPLSEQLPDEFDDDPTFKPPKWFLNQIRALKPSKWIGTARPHPTSDSEDEAAPPQSVKSAHTGKASQVKPKKRRTKRQQAMKRKEAMVVESEDEEVDELANDDEQTPGPTGPPGPSSGKPARRVALIVRPEPADWKTMEVVQTQRRSASGGPGGPAGSAGPAHPPSPALPFEDQSSQLDALLEEVRDLRQEIDIVRGHQKWLHAALEHKQASQNDLMARFVALEKALGISPATHPHATSAVPENAQPADVQPVGTGELGPHQEEAATASGQSNKDPSHPGRAGTPLASPTQAGKEDPRATPEGHPEQREGGEIEPQPEGPADPQLEGPADPQPDGPADPEPDGPADSQPDGPADLSVPEQNPEPHPNDAIDNVDAQGDTGEDAHGQQQESGEIENN
ncbi:hypothetical protein C8Q76DRAFT_804128 [Earliella scabrosa]|nr:hypothetical protein C8Q76DRAFT_804128 [Earliella scabrosa]